VPPLPARLRRPLAWLSVAVAIWAAIAWLSGGGILEVGPLRLSSRSAERPAVAAALLGALALLSATADQRRAALKRTRRAADGNAALGAALLAIAITLTSVVIGELVAGGADSSGYLHQAQLWEAGRATLDAPLLDQGPWPLAGWEAAPLVHGVPWPWARRPASSTSK